MSTRSLRLPKLSPLPKLTARATSRSNLVVKHVIVLSMKGAKRMHHRRILKTSGVSQAVLLHCTPTATHITACTRLHVSGTARGAIATVTHHQLEVVCKHAEVLACTGTDVGSNSRKDFSEEVTGYNCVASWELGQATNIDRRSWQKSRKPCDLPCGKADQGKQGSCLRAQPPHMSVIGSSRTEATPLAHSQRCLQEGVPWQWAPSKKVKAWPG